MRVLQVHNPYRQQGGEDQVVAAEAELLVDHGFEVVQHLLPNPATTSESVAGLLRAPWNHVSSKVIGELIDEMRPDVVHVHNTWYMLSPAVIAAAHRRAPIVLTLHNYRLACINGQLLRDSAPCRLCIDGTLWNGIVHSCYRDRVTSSLAALTIRTGRSWAWPMVDLFLALSDFAAGLLGETGIARHRIAVKDNYVPDPGPRSNPAAASDDVLFVGRLSPEKGIHQLMANRKVLAKTGLRLLVIGDGPLRSDVESALGDNYLGRMPSSEVAGRMLEARALVMPSIWYEGQPRTALEAFAAGLPVMGSDLGAIGELLRAQPGPWTFNPHGDWTTMSEILASDEQVEAGSVSARRLWEERFNAKRAVDSLTSAYQRAIDSHRGHG